MNVQPLPQKCPKCAHEGYWDNRKDKKNPKAPDFKCKNKACGDGVWLQKGSVWADLTGTTTASATGYQSPSYTSPGAPDFLKEQVAHEAATVAGIQQGIPAKLQAVFSLYDACMDHVLSVNVPKLARAGVESTDQGVSAMTATLLIAAKDRGIAA